MYLSADASFIVGGSGIGFPTKFVLTR